MQLYKRAFKLLSCESLNNNHDDQRPEIRITMDFAVLDQVPIRDTLLNAFQFNHNCLYNQVSLYQINKDKEHDQPMCTNTDLFEMNLRLNFMIELKNSEECLQN